MTLSSFFSYNENEIPGEGRFAYEIRQPESVYFVRGSSCRMAGKAEKGVGMHLIGKEAEAFKVQAFCRGKFEEVTKESLLFSLLLFLFILSGGFYICVSHRAGRSAGLL